MLNFDEWIKSSRSQGNGAQCVEAKLIGDGVSVRDSKLGGGSPVLSGSRADWMAFVRSVETLRK